MKDKGGGGRRQAEPPDHRAGLTWERRGRGKEVGLKARTSAVLGKFQPGSWGIPGQSPVGSPTLHSNALALAPPSQPGDQ